MKVLEQTENSDDDLPMDTNIARLKYNRSTCPGLDESKTERSTKMSNKTNNREDDLIFKGDKIIF